MITKEQFIKHINLVQSEEKELDKWKDIGIDIWSSDLVQNLYEHRDLVIELTFDVEGQDWINWWLYEAIKIDDAEAIDENGNDIPTRTIDDLWNLVENHRI